MKLRINYLCVLLFCFAFNVSAQNESFSYKRSLETNSETWHTILLEDEMLSKLNSDLSDIRILGITKTNDTIEAPYFTTVLKDKISNKSIAFELLNTSKTEAGYFFTFKPHTNSILETIDLKFSNPNFDWLAQLEGSNNASDWFQIIDDYRIVSIVNSNTNYSFTRLNFPKSEYNYYRLFIKNAEKPHLISATLKTKDLIKGSYSEFAIKNWDTNLDKKAKTSVFTFNLKHPYTISKFNIGIKTSFDYFRTFKLEYLSDSLKTETGTHYYYKPLYNGTLSAFEANNFNFKNTLCKTLRLTIYNNDNAPLEITNITVKGPKYQLTARFNTNAKYSLYYGSNNLKAPKYDILNFKSTVPNTLKALNLGEAQSIKNRVEATSKNSSFFNASVLWIVMGIVILLLGIFTLKMLKNA